MQHPIFGAAGWFYAVMAKLREPGRHHTRSEKNSASADDDKNDTGNWACPASPQSNILFRTHSANSTFAVVGAHAVHDEVVPVAEVHQNEVYREFRCILSPQYGLGCTTER
jgi:hypothetical protein